MDEGRNTKAIRGWFAVHRPDVEKSIVDNLISTPPSFALLAAGFEAGRHFQAEYPYLDPMDTAVYSTTNPMPKPPDPVLTPAEVVASIGLPADLPAPDENVEVDGIKPKSKWIHRRTSDECTVTKVEGEVVIVADSFGDARRIPTYMFRQSYNPKGG